MMAGIQRVPLQSEIIQFLYRYIQDNQFRPGDRLPSQEKMVEMMGVSRTALREAIKTLEARDVLETINGKGIYVKNLSSENILTQLEFTREKELLLEVLEARKILEREIVTLVVKNITEEELDALGDVLKVILEKYHQGKRQNMEDKKFHYMVYEYSHNRIMQQLILSIRGAMDKLWEFPLNMESPFTETIPLHEKFYEALRARNLKKAQFYNSEILDKVVQDILKSEYREKQKEQ